MSNIEQPSPAQQGIPAVGYGRPPVATRFRPGRSGNPAGGRRTAGASVREWLNALSGRTRAEVLAVAQNPAAPALKGSAAAVLLLACSTGLTSAGMPVAGPAMAFILRQTLGRPRRADRQADAAGGVWRPPRPAVNVAAVEAELLALVDGAAVAQGHRMRLVDGPRPGRRRQVSLRVEQPGTAAPRRSVQVAAVA